MKTSLATLVLAFGLAGPAFAQSEAIWSPCLDAEPTMEGLIGALQAEGWAFPTSNEEHVRNLQAAAEALFAMQNLPNVATGPEYDRHIALAHETGEAMLIDAATLQRDGLVVAVEAVESGGGMIRCTFAGNEFEEVAYAFDGGGDDIRTVNGHEIVTVAPPDAATVTDITLYRLLAPADATAEARGTFAAIAIRHLQ
ncbi:hypothetical protein SAMN06295905_1016 [Devosia lucknowensis]|uniref:Uncharacterized protein n=1 Tax=Devosia lucknowensis TaxID=1096929 RepID=A0A1Y6EQJ9_9HYPH|nr:hypothetical protein [Devosia lucknowensis]SMQ64606.1 hypothetical protein SAMN06295905_1016 [Devosia lucknowensis]